MRLKQISESVRTDFSGDKFRPYESKHREWTKRKEDNEMSRMDSSKPISALTGKADGICVSDELN